MKKMQREQYTKYLQKNETKNKQASQISFVI